MIETAHFALGSRINLLTTCKCCSKPSTWWTNGVSSKSFQSSVFSFQKGMANHVLFCYRNAASCSSIVFSLKQKIKSCCCCCCRHLRNLNRKKQMRIENRFYTFSYHRHSLRSSHRHSLWSQWAKWAAKSSKANRQFSPTSPIV